MKQSLDCRCVLVHFALKNREWATVLVIYLHAAIDPHRRACLQVGVTALFWGHIFETSEDFS